MLRQRATRHSKAQNANFVLRKCWVHLNHHCARIFISGYHAEIKYKNVLFYFKAFSHVMGYHDGTQNFTIRKYDILAFKWRVLSIFSIPGSKVIPKNKRTLVKCRGLYCSLLTFSLWTGHNQTFSLRTGHNLNFPLSTKLFLWHETNVTNDKNYFLTFSSQNGHKLNWCFWHFSAYSSGYKEWFSVYAEK